jgi:phenylacetate-CoA ligase
VIERLRHRLHRRLQPQRYALLAQLLRNQSLTRAQLLHRQARDLAALVRHAAAHVPYYAARIDADTLAAFARGEADIGRLPILRKDDVRSHLGELLARDADRAQAKLGHTGGSTGQPLAFWYDDAKHELMRAGMMRGYMMSGWRPGQKILNLWGARQDVVAGGVFGNGLFDVIAAERTIAAWEYSDANLHAWAHRVRRYRPTLLQGYASALTELARYVLAEHLRMPDSLIGVYSTAEVLDDSQRELMQRAFGCKVYNQYGSREVPNIAWECRHGGMHVCADLVWLETRHVDGEDRLLVTSLTNRLMPFIRYDIGDTGRLLDGTCPCGSPFPLMEMGVCRRNDLIHTCDGRRIHPAYFNRLLYGQTGIRQYQWVQRDCERIELNVVAAEPLPPTTVAELARRIQADVSPAMTLQVNTVPEIPRTRSGKHRYVIGIGDMAAVG